MAKRKFSENTSTASFGSPGREGHDASAFYEARLYADQPQAEAGAYNENLIPSLDVIFHRSSEEMTELPDNSVHLMVTSPPYNVGKEYDEDLTLDEYLAVRLPPAERAQVNHHRRRVHIALIDVTPPPARSLLRNLRIERSVVPAAGVARWRAEPRPTQPDGRARTGRCACFPSARLRPGGGIRVGSRISSVTPEAVGHPGAWEHSPAPWTRYS